MHKKLMGLAFCFATFAANLSAATTPTITWATPAAITYGTTLSATQLDATASVAGTFAYTPASGSTPAVGTDTLSVTFTPTDTTDYTTATKTVSLVVNKATPVITWATPAAITEGTALSATQLNATASVAGTFAYSPATGTILAVGSTTLSATFTPTTTADYNTVTETVTLTVNPVATGTLNAIPMFTGTSTLGNSIITQSGGRIGIGTSSPGSPLTLQDSSGDTISFAIDSTATYPFFINQTGLAAWAFSGATGNVMTLTPYNAAGGFNLNYKPGSTALSVISNGKVGIGTTAPAYTLDVAGPIRSSSGGIVFPDGSTQTTASTAGSGNSLITQTGGDVGIGTTSPTQALTEWQHQFDGCRCWSGDISQVNYNGSQRKYRHQSNLTV